MSFKAAAALIIKAAANADYQINPFISTPHKDNTKMAQTVQ